MKQATKRSSNKAWPRDLTPRQWRAQQVRDGRFLPLGEMEPIEIPSPQALAGLLPDIPVDDRDRHYVNLQLDYRASLLLKRLQTPLGLAQWFGTLGRRGVKAFKPFTVREPDDRRDWKGSDGWLFCKQVDALIKDAPSHQRTKKVEWAIHRLQSVEPKWLALDAGTLKTQYRRLKRAEKKKQQVKERW
jgi:hypothetical protein